jgi:glycosyltransferase involved in cell wall biosynthesis
MRIAFFYPSSSMRIPIDLRNIWTSSRGLTGSEISCIMYVLLMSRLGHSVTLFTKVAFPGDIEKVTVCPYNEWASMYHKQEWDALCSWMLPEPLKIANPSQFRLFNQQVSDFICCEPGWESYVDILTPLSHSHANYLAKYTEFPHDKWRISYNGVDCNEFKPGKKESGKVIWASSHDRGLHWLLEAWPHIRAQVPHANLHIFYDFNGINTFSKQENYDSSTEDGRCFNELGQRSRYVLEALRRMNERYGIFTHKSVSRNQIKEEMATSQILAYPLDPVRYTETFGVTVLEACASGTVPVICEDDCFKELWSPVSETVPPPYSEHKGEFVSKVVGILNDHEKREFMALRCREYAQTNFDWSVLKHKFEQTLLSRGENGLSNVVWKI